MQKKGHEEHTINSSRLPGVLDASISQIRSVSPTIKTLTLSIDKKTIHQTFKAGQWVDFFIPGIEQVGGFSMWNGPDSFAKSGELELAVKRSSWAPADWVHNKCQPGDKVAVRFGGDIFYSTTDWSSTDRDDSRHSLLLIAGGVGINPLLSIWFRARHSIRSESKVQPSKVHLFYSASVKEELIFRDVINCTTKELPNFQVSYYTTKETCDFAESGRIQFDHLNSKLNQMKPERTLVYLCGPPKMITDMRDMLVAMGHPENDIYYELWY